MIKLLKINSILYVEDEKIIQKELAEILEKLCNKLYLADDGVQGLTQYNNYKPDIIISDIKMPFMNGIEMAKNIKKQDPKAHIIFTTAFSDTEFFQEALQLQVEGYILKPIDLALLINKINDVIELINLQRDLEQKEQILIQQSKLASMGEMIGNIAHQWRQPLSAISMKLNNISAEKDLGTFEEEQIDECIQSISSQLEYLSTTIDDFSSFFKPSIEYSNYNIYSFLQKSIDLVKASFSEYMIETIQNIDQKINSYGDPKQLVQALINILNNSKDALKNAQNIHKKLVFIISAKEENDEYLIIKIKDNGGGIPQQIIDKVFDPYFTTKHKSQGTGLGLYITHTIITKNLHGFLSVKNSEFEYKGIPYKGAEFEIKLPLSESLHSNLDKL